VFQAILIGLGIGGVYAISALGIVTINRGTGVLNLSHGVMATWGAYLYVSFAVNRGWPQPAAMAAVLALSGAAGAVVYLVLIRPIRHRTPLTKMVMTLGVQGLLIALLERTFNTTTQVSVPSWLPDGGVRIFGASVGEDRLILLGLALLLTVVLEVWSSRARLPLATRALCDNERAAMALGASPNVLGAINWVLGAALAGGAGALLVPIVGLGETNVSSVLVPALAAALLGRFISFPAALAGGLILGVGQSVVTWYITTPGWGNVVPLVVIVVALTFQRRQEGNRISAQAAPQVGTGRFPLIPSVVALAGVVLVLSLMHGTWLDAMITSLCYAVLGLSVVVLLGFAYQMSLAQMALAGVGALVAAQLAIHAHLPFIIAPLVGAVAGALVGVVVGLPALRIRGVNLAIVTLGLSLAIESVVFDSDRYTGGFNGLTPPTPTIFGADVSVADHPARYGFVVLAWLVIALVGVWALRRSGFGHRLIAVRTNERASSSIGVDITRAKLGAFAISAGLAGLAGVLLGFQQSSISFLEFNSAASMSLVVLVVIAGVGAISGAVVVGLIATGGIVFQLFSGVSWVQNNYLLISSIGLVIAVIQNEHGIVILPAGIRRWIPKPRAPKPVSAELMRANAVAAAPGAVLRAKDVRAAFGGVVAVDGIGLAVEPGRVVGVIGPNGAGKTTLLDILSGFLPGRRYGSVTLGAAELNRLATFRRARAGIGRGFQAIELFEDLSVRENFDLAARNARRSSNRMSVVTVDAIEHFGLAGSLDVKPSALSLAQRRLAGVVRALAANPSVLILDEPGAGLTRSESMTLGRELRDIAARANLGVLVIDHDMGLITAACDELVVMAAGAEVARGAPKEVLANSLVREIYLGESPSVTDDHPADQARPAEHQPEQPQPAEQPRYSR
jgi:ABC-type branched-subunit amino acid transport system permease subunit/ABC-type branched-subunit amino acid transport system ATPase component